MVVCRDATEMVSDYIERSLPVRRRLQLGLHLLRREPCRRYFDQMRRTIALLGSHPRPALPKDAEERLVAALRQPPTE